MTISDKVSMFYNAKPIIFVRAKAMIQHTKVAFRKSPPGDLGVKIKDMKGILIIEKQNLYRGMDSFLRPRRDQRFLERVVNEKNRNFRFFYQTN